MENFETQNLWKWYGSLIAFHTKRMNKETSDLDGGKCQKEAEIMDLTTKWQ